ncbi:hypothetical protein BgiBS90_019408, partial [Biomphalaria glabrata]
KGGFLVTIKTSAEMALVSQNAKNWAFWIGCDDKKEKGTYVWHDDGRPVQDVEKTLH